MTASNSQSSIGELVRKMEDDYTRGNVTISEYVHFDMYDTINKIEAYLNSKHTSGEFDSLGREKPFFNIVTAASNIWYKATDIDRKNIKIKATKKKDVIDAFLATVHLQRWMTQAKFGHYLNEWGRVLARYGSAVTKVVEKNGELIITVVPWNRIICDQVDFTDNPKIEVQELSEAQLYRRKEFSKEQITALCSARKARETLRKQRKDNKSDYIKLYEVHGEFPLSYITGKEKDEDEYVQQMHIVSYVQGKKKGEYEDFTLFSGREAKDPYRIAHLIKEDGRALAIGAVEHLFQPQWMVNHTAKSIKDELDLASKLIFQTSDASFVGQNALSAIENGDILIHAINQPLTQINNGSHDITQLQNYGGMWKTLANEIVGISEAMLGAAPKAGTAWRQTEALLQESYSLFELMTENKGLDLEDLLRGDVLPHIKKKMNNKEEISATLEQNDIEWVDSKYIKNFAVSQANKFIKEKNRAYLRGERATPVSSQEQMMMTSELEGEMKKTMGETGNQRFFKPSEISNNTWKEQFKDLEFDLEVDITGENKDYQSDMATLSTALTVVMNPAYQQNQEAQMIVGEILKQSSGLSPLQLSQVRAKSPLMPPVAPQGESTSGVPTLPTVTEQ
jgi:hypothetical protein